MAKARDIIDQVVEAKDPFRVPRSAETIKEDPRGDVWRCPQCHKVNVWSWMLQDRVKELTGEEVAISTGSAFDNICGHCRANIVRRDSPIRAEVYTHEPSPKERSRMRLAKLRGRRPDLD